MKLRWTLFFSINYISEWSEFRKRNGNAEIISPGLWLWKLHTLLYVISSDYHRNCPLLNATNEINCFRENKWSLGASSKYILTLSVAGGWPWTCAGKKSVSESFDKRNQCSCLNPEKKEVRAFEEGFSPLLIFDIVQIRTSTFQQFKCIILKHRLVRTGGGFLSGLKCRGDDSLGPVWTVETLHLGPKTTSWKRQHKTKGIQPANSTKHAGLKKIFFTSKKEKKQTWRK